MPENSSSVFTQSPASTAFSTLYTRALNYVLGTSDTNQVTVAKEGINEGILRLNTVDWWWSRIALDVTLVAGTQEYALGTTFRKPRACETLNTAGEVNGQLGWVDPKEFEAVYYDRSTTGSPSAYTIFNEFVNGMVTLSCPPSSGFIAVYPKLRLRYYRRTAVLSGDSDLLAAPTEVEPFLTWLARATLAAHWAPEKVAFAETRAEKLWSLLRRENTTHELGDF